MQKFDVCSALLAETYVTLKENQRTTFVVFHWSALFRSKKEQNHLKCSRNPKINVVVPILPENAPYLTADVIPPLNPKLLLATFISLCNAMHFWMLQFAALCENVREIWTKWTSFSPQNQ